MGPSITIGQVEVPFFSISTVPLLGVIAAALLYLRACSVLADRGRTVPMHQRACYFGGLTLILLGTQTFIDPVGESALLSLHMAQHLLIADLTAPLLLLGVRAPVVYFFWPRPVLVRVARLGLLRRLWAWLRRPPVALTTWLVVLFAWHMPVLYEAALTNRALHDLEHVMFVLTAVLAWWPLLDPTHHRVEGRLWKAGYVVAARTIGGTLGIFLLMWPRQVYSSYGDSALQYGTTMLIDQQSAGGMMMLVDFVIVTVGVLTFIALMGEGDEHPSSAAMRDGASPSR